MDLVYVMVNQNTPYGISIQPSLVDTNAEEVKNLHDAIQSATTLPIVPHKGLLNINHIKLFGASEDNLITKWLNTPWIPKVSKDKEIINIKTQILNDDVGGITFIRVIHSICMLSRINNDKSFLKYLLNCWNTETKLLKLFNSIRGKLRKNFFT